jgi:hypothetical protein
MVSCGESLRPAHVIMARLSVYLFDSGRNRLLRGENEMSKTLAIVLVVVGLLIAAVTPILFPGRLLISTTVLAAFWLGLLALRSTLSKEMTAERLLKSMRFTIVMTGIAATLTVMAMAKLLIRTGHQEVAIR